MANHRRQGPPRRLHGRGGAGADDPKLAAMLQQAHALQQQQQGMGTIEIEQKLVANFTVGWADSIEEIFPTIPLQNPGRDGQPTHPSVLRAVKQDGSGWAFAVDWRQTDWLRERLLETAGARDHLEQRLRERLARAGQHCDDTTLHSYLDALCEKEPEPETRPEPEEIDVPADPGVIDEETAARIRALRDSVDTGEVREPEQLPDEDDGA